MSRIFGKAHAPRVSTVGGKFNSIGSAKVQSENSALMVRLCGEIGIDGYQTLTPADKIFIDDVRHKLRSGGNLMFGWRQIEHMVEVHKAVVQARLEASNAKSRK